MRTKSHFTMIELMLALGVCVIGICGVMVLFPIGANASRDAAMETYAANAADQMLNYLKYVITSDNEKWVDDYIKEASPSDVNTLPESMSSIDLADVILDTTVWARPAAPMGSITKNVFRYTGDATVKGVYQLISFRNDQTTGVDQTTDVAINSPLIDFRAIMNVWRQQVSMSSTYALPWNMAVQLNVEVSWPAALPYDARQKSRYVLEVFNPNFIP